MDIQSTSTTTPAPATPSHLWAGKSFSFHDVLDAINPLQHLPIIATIYRHLTGDTIGNAARVAGDTLYTGPIGLALSLVDAHEVNKTGKDLGEHVVAMISGHGKDTAPTVAASAVPAAQLPTVPVPTPDSAQSSVPQPAIPMTTALTALKSRPAIDLPAFPTLPRDNGQAVAANAMPAASAAPMPLTPLLPQSRPVPVMALPAAAHGFAIDTSSTGIAAMRGHVQSGAGVPFQLPAGVMLTNQPKALATTTGVDFALKMKQGLAKYQALLADQAAHHGVAAAQPAS